jgi:hypothetical protein
MLTGEAREEQPTCTRFPPDFAGTLGARRHLYPTFTRLVSDFHPTRTDSNPVRGRCRSPIGARAALRSRRQVVAVTCRKLTGAGGLRRHPTALTAGSGARGEMTSTNHCRPWAERPRKRHLPERSTHRACPLGLRARSPDSRRAVMATVAALGRRKLWPDAMVPPHKTRRAARTLRTALVGTWECQLRRPIYDFVYSEARTSVRRDGLWQQPLPAPAITPPVVVEGDGERRPHSERPSTRRRGRGTLPGPIACSATLARSGGIRDHPVTVRCPSPHRRLIRVLGNGSTGMDRLPWRSCATDDAPSLAVRHGRRPWPWSRKGGRTAVAVLPDGEAIDRLT